MTTYSYSSESAAEVKAALLIVPVFEGLKPGPGVRETGLAKAFADAKHTGKRGEALLVTRRDRDGFAAGAVLLVGAGAKDEFTVEAARR
ncbi:MAG: M17 family peptidase N-terminal domain-containing protein, partial [Actinomycetota bacterium]